MAEREDDGSGRDPEELARALQRQASLASSPGGSGRSNAPPTVEHPFWDTQPVPPETDPLDELDAELLGPLIANADVEVKHTPYALPDSFSWCDVNLDDDAELAELYTLLNQNYVEDSDAHFRFDYSTNFLRWAMQPPGFKRSWHVGVRVASNKKLVAFIGATPAALRCCDKIVGTSPPEADDASRPDLAEPRTVEVNFLCVHKKLRSKRLAPVLIRELTRRVNVEGLFQACYTGGTKLPRHIARTTYWHRSLNIRKLVDIGFTRLGPRMTMVRQMKILALPDTPQLPGFRPMVEADVEVACAKLNKKLRNFRISQIFSVDEFRHWLLTRDGVIYSYVVEAPESGEITDFVSFYMLPSSVLRSTKHSTLGAAYAYYHFNEKAELKALMQDALIAARNLDNDVFNMLNLMENESVFKDLKFGMGDGSLHYYLYNWRSNELEPKEVGLVLL